VIAGSILLWAAAGQWHLNLPNYPNPGGWFFDPLSWQLIFVIGLFSGVAMRERRALVPFDPVLFWAALGLVVFIGLWVKIDALGAFGRDQLLAPLSHAGFPDYFVWFDKTMLALPRLLHALALAYVLSSIPAIGTLAGSSWAAPLALLGRHGLPVFATGSVLDMVIQAVKARTGQDPLVDAALLLAGLLALLLLSDMLDRIKRARMPAAIAAARSPARGDLVVSPAE
jgi:hypothetical protein